MQSQPRRQSTRLNSCASTGYLKHTRPMLSKKHIDEFVAKHRDISFLWGKESVPPEKPAALIEKVGILPCKDCKRFFQTLEGSPYREAHGTFNRKRRMNSRLRYKDYRHDAQQKISLG